MLVGPLGRPLGIRGEICLCAAEKVWAHRGQQETPVIPDSVDALDGCDVLEGVVGARLATGRRVWRVD
jgi:hypothetical protein